MIKPVGFQLLLKPLEGEDQTKGGIFLPDQVKEINKIAATVCKVIDMGPDCYLDPTRFPSGHWCQIGDYVLIGKFSGARFIYEKEEFRLINDDQITGIVDDPESISRVM